MDICLKKNNRQALSKYNLAWLITKNIKRGKEKQQQKKCINANNEIGM